MFFVSYCLWLASLSPTFPPIGHWFSLYGRRVQSTSKPGDIWWPLRGGSTVFGTSLYASMSWEGTNLICSICFLPSLPSFPLSRNEVLGRATKDKVAALLIYNHNHNPVKTECLDWCWCVPADFNRMKSASKSRYSGLSVLQNEPLLRNVHSFLMPFPLSENLATIPQVCKDIWRGSKKSLSHQAGFSQQPAIFSEKGERLGTATIKLSCTIRFKFILLK